MDRLTREEIDTLIDDLIVAHPIYTPQLRALREQSLSQEVVRDEALEALEEGYAALADVTNQWKGRHTIAGQKLLCKMRDAIANATGRSAEDVQDNPIALKREPNAAAQASPSVVPAESNLEFAAGPAPAAPESETPETDAICSAGFVSPLAALARSLERRLSLAQTEIKGHMRVEDELRAELKLGPHITGAAPAYTGEGVSMLEVSSVAHVNPRKGRAAIYERAFQLERELALAQARIAELEKEYYELIYAVGNKYPHETRHQTALRYIQQAERGGSSTTATVDGPKSRA